ncbi:MAG: serine/threonine protein kinase [Kofleriaceae bacterium]|nr:serine/threonine protein kinase [Kofleriaceae bacterium]
MAADSANVLAATLVRLQATLKGVLPSPGETIRSLPLATHPTISAAQHDDSAPFVAAGSDEFTLPFLHVAGARASTATPNNEADLRMIGVLGEGGMGRVDLATQRVFDRTVAVKRVRPDQQGTAAMAALIREARTTGSLEHPNIVPAYALGRGDDGPMLIMKRVQGVPWSTLIYHDDDAAWRDFQGDRLGRHLEILMQVCNGIELAHRRGVVHRDLKPDNIMVGDLGEVYVLDWGVAVHLNEPRNDAIAGTPSYMAPEMLNGSIDISARTDVYLLGGLLHEVLAHAPRHAGNVLSVVLVSVFESAPFTYDPTVPRELAEICNRATAHDPADRFDSALAFRTAVAKFLEHRGSLDLCAQADLHLTHLRRILAEPDSTEGGVDSRDEVRRLAAEADFGFRQALRIWPDNEVASAHRQASLELMIGFEVEQKNAPGALALLRQLPEPRPALQARVAELQASLRADAAARAQLERLDREGDARVAANPRVALALLFYGGLGTLCLVIALLGVTFTTFTLLMTFGVALPIYAAFVWFGRRVLLETQINRRMHASLLTSVGWATLVTYFGWRTNMSVDFAVAFWVSGYALSNMTIAIWTGTKTAKPSIALICITFTPAIGICLFWPGHAALALSVACYATIPVAMIRSRHWSVDGAV